MADELISAASDKRSWHEYFEDHNRYSGVYRTALKQQRLLDLIIKHADERGRLCESGFGTGTLSFLLADLGYQVHSFDYDGNCVDAANNRFARASCEFSQGDLFDADTYSRMLRGGEKFSVIFHSGVLEHFPDERIVTILRLQRKYGRKIIFSVPSFRNDHSGDAFGDERFLVPSKWKSLARESGFQSVFVSGGRDFKYMPRYLKGITPRALFSDSFRLLGIYTSKHTILVCA